MCSGVRTPHEGKFNPALYWWPHCRFQTLTQTYLGSITKENIHYGWMKSWISILSNSWNGYSLKWNCSYICLKPCLYWAFWCFPGLGGWFNIKFKVLTNSISTFWLKKDLEWRQYFADVINFFLWRHQFYVARGNKKCPFVNILSEGLMTLKKISYTFEEKSHKIPKKSKKFNKIH